MSDLLVRAARGESVERPPVWIMRQAGRYIPRYREIREDLSFKEAIKDPEVAEEITLLPYDIFEPDGVVMFSDILTVLEPMGFDYHLKSGVGPVIENPVLEAGDVTGRDLSASREDIEREIEYVGLLLERLNDSVGDLTSIIGFSGGPYTLASYVVGESKGRKDIRRLRARHPREFQELLEEFADVVCSYLEYQEEMGADVVQVFDTWAGVLTNDDYREFLQPLHSRIVDSVSVPVILFTRNTGPKLELLDAAGPDVVGVDWTVDIDEARERIDAGVQGNLDPSYLLGGKEFIEERTLELIERGCGENDSGHVVNLGHGISRDTPVENAEEFVETVKGYRY
ncbi:MAG: uroporphyrinogen decarboxylase [Halobacteria archaeon]